MSTESDLRDLLAIATASDGFFCLQFDALVTVDDPKERMRRVMLLLKESAQRSSAIFDAIKAGGPGRHALAQFWIEVSKDDYESTESLTRQNGQRQ